MSDKEISDGINASIAILSTHTTGTQSGVLPLSASLGVPVISRKIPGASQFKSGGIELISENAIGKDWYDACSRIYDNQDKYVAGAEMLYKNFFSEDNFIKYYKNLFIE